MEEGRGVKKGEREGERKERRERKQRKQGGR